MLVAHKVQQKQNSVSPVAQQNQNKQPNGFAQLAARKWMAAPFAQTVGQKDLKEGLWQL